MTPPTTTSDLGLAEREPECGLTSARTGHSGSLRSLARRCRRPALVSLGVVAIHAALLVLLLQAGTGWRAHQEASSPDPHAMQMQFIAMDLTAVPTHPPPEPPPTPPSPSAIERATEHATAAPRPVMVPPAQEARTGELPKITMPAGDLPQSDIGGRLTPGQPYQRHNVRLPGGIAPRGAPRLRMVDPRSQGLAVAAIRLIGSFTGAVDAHCVDLDTWQGMTAEERLASHVSQGDMDRAAAHGCRDPRPRFIRTPPVTR